jgi:hypothetical protein
MSQETVTVVTAFNAYTSPAGRIGCAPTRVARSRRSSRDVIPPEVTSDEGARSPVSLGPRGCDVYERGDG